MRHRTRPFLPSVALPVVSLLASLAGCAPTASSGESSGGEVAERDPIRLSRVSEDERNALTAASRGRVERAADRLERRVRSRDAAEAQHTSVRPKAVRVDEYGVTHARLSLAHRGIPVLGAEVISHIGADGADVELSGRGEELLPVEPTSVQAGISATDARLIALAEIGTTDPLSAPVPTLSLLPETEDVIRPEAQDKAELNAADIERRVLGHTLVYVARVVAHEETGGAQEHVLLIDAEVGDVLRHERLGASMGDFNIPGIPLNGHSQYRGQVFLPVTTNDDGTYTLADPGRGKGHPFMTWWTGGNAALDMGGEDPHGTRWPEPFESELNSWGTGENYTAEDYLTHDTGSNRGQTAAVDAAYATMVTWDLFSSVFHRDGLDERGSAMLVWVHASRTTGRDAYWDSRQQVVVLADPDSPARQATSLDIVGHELGHGFFQYAVGAGEAPHPYNGEFGGINEGNSDIIGVLVEFLSSTYPWGNHTVIPSTGGNWTVGEDLLDGHTRYLYHPSLNGRAYDEWFLGIDDAAQRPHDTSGPIGRMFYFLSQGAKPELVDPDRSTRHLPEGFAGIGNHKAARVWYRAISDYLIVGDRFMNLREACLLAARDLYGAYSTPYKAVMNAFAAVNVGEPADSVPPAITLRVERSATSLTIVADVDDASEIAEVGFSLVGPNRSFGAISSTPPFSLTVSLAEAMGQTYGLNVSARDVFGNESTVQRTIDLTPPTTRGVFCGGNLRERCYQARVEDDVRVAYAELYLDGVFEQRVYVPMTLTGPSQMCVLDTGCNGWPQPVAIDFQPLDLRHVATGLHRVTIVGYDGAGNSHSWTSGQFFIDNTAPVVVAQATKLSSANMWRLRATIVDDVVEGMRSRFFVDGQLHCERVGTQTPSCDYDARMLADGPHVLRVVAVDGAWQNQGEHSVTFVVSSPPPPPPPAQTYFDEVEPNNGDAWRSVYGNIFCGTHNNVPDNVTRIRGATSSNTDVDRFRLRVRPGQRLRARLVSGGSCQQLQYWLTTINYNGLSCSMSDADLYNPSWSGDTIHNTATYDVQPYLHVVRTGSSCGSYEVSIDRW